MLARLWWKEWRTFGPAWLVLTLAAAGLQWLLLWARSDDVRWGSLTPAALSWAVLYAFGVGAAAFAGERETGALGFLDALPVGRPTLWLGKATFALASTLGLALLLAGLAAIGTERREPDYIYGYRTVAMTFGTLLFEAVAWGFLWSSISRNPLLSGAMTVVSVAAISVYSHLVIPTKHLVTASELVDEEAVPARLMLAAVALTISAAVVSLRPRWFRLPASPTRAEATTDRREGVIPIRRSSAARSLDWQAAREGWTTGLLVALVGLVLPIAAAMRGNPLHSPMNLCLAVLASLLAGVGVFGESGPDSRRFLVQQGVWPGDVWGRRMWVWGLGMAAFLAAFLVGFALPDAPSPDGGRPELGRPGLTSLEAVAAVVDAFAVGVLCGMAIPRRITAAMVGVIGVLAVVPLQVALASFGMIPGWSLFLMPAALLGVSRAWAGDWLGEREGMRPWARLGLLLAGSMALLGSTYVAHRAWGVPDVGPQFDATTARVEPIPPGQDAAEGYRRALALVKESPGLARPGNGRGLDPVAEVIERGWDRGRLGVVAWWRENREAIDAARVASALPRARFRAIERMTIATPPDPVVPGIQALDELLALDARERLSRGDLSGAWGDILALFRIAGHLAADNPTLSRLATAAQAHHRASGLAMEWAGAPGQAPGTIREAREELKSLPPLPSAAGAIRVESLLLDRALDLPAEDLYGLYRAYPQGQPGLIKALEIGLVAPWWERIRARRVCRRLVAEILSEAGLEPWQRASPAIFDAVPEGSPLSRLMLPAFGSVVGTLDREAVRRRALEQILALRSWQLDHGGAYPETLEALVPAELDRLPIDPFSGRPFGYVLSRGQGARPPILPDHGPAHLRPTRPGQPILYSVGPDGVDDGGRSAYLFGVENGGDVLIPLP